MTQDQHRIEFYRAVSRESSIILCLRSLVSVCACLGQKRFIPIVLVLKNLLFLFGDVVHAQNLKLQDLKLSKQQFDARRWPYPLHAEVTAHLQDLTSRHATLARLHNIGQSVGGRDLWLLEITNSETGPGESKPGIWIDGNLHPDELPGRRYLRYFVERGARTD